MNEKTPPLQSAISELELYPLQEALRRLGIGRAAYRSAVRQGLRTIRRLGRTFVSGKEIIRFLTDGEQ